MIVHFSLILFSLLLLFLGAEGLVRGSSSLGLRAGLTPLTIGLTVVAFGTSSPELVVSLKATLANQADIALGNVIGSNIFNIGIILGLTALICPVPVQLQIVRIDTPIMIATAAALPLFLYNGLLGRIDGAILFTGICVYTLLNIRMARKAAKLPASDVLTAQAEKKATGHWMTDLLFILGGLVILVIGSRLLVSNAIIVARTFSISEAVIGLTIIAAGTSLPELATSLVAAVRKQPDIAVGNVVGSNIFNILAILGISSLVSPLRPEQIKTMDYLVMIGASVLLLPMLYSQLKLIRIEGFILLLGYCVYVMALMP